MPDSFFTTTAGRRWLETQIFPAWMPQQRWFAGKARGPRTFTIARQAAFGDAWLLAVEVTYATGPNDTYLVPLVIGPASAKVMGLPSPGANEDAEGDVPSQDGPEVTGISVVKLKKLLSPAESLLPGRLADPGREPPRRLPWPRPRAWYTSDFYRRPH